MAESAYDGARRMSTPDQRRLMAFDRHDSLDPIKDTMDSYGVGWAEAKGHLKANWEHYGAPKPSKNPKPMNNWLMHTHDNEPEQFHYLMRNIVHGSVG